MEFNTSKRSLGLTLLAWTGTSVIKKTGPIFFYFSANFLSPLYLVDCIKFCFIVSHCQGGICRSHVCSNRCSYKLVIIFLIEFEIVVLQDKFDDSEMKAFGNIGYIDASCFSGQKLIACNPQSWGMLVYTGFLHQMCILQCSSLLFSCTSGEN